MLRSAAALWLMMIGMAIAGIPAGAQSASVVGMVRGASGEPLVHAQVLVAPGGQGAMTDRTGRFVLRNLHPGRHRLEVSLIGYAPAQREIVVPPAGGEVELEVALTPTPLSLPGVHVTGSPSGRDALSATQSMLQLRGRALERSLAGTLAQTLADQPGIGVRYNGPAASAPIVRGLTGDRILLLQDGIRSADLAGSADDHTVAIDPLSAQRIEVVRGPAALMYGNNALGGVVNVITSDIAAAVPDRAELFAGMQSESAHPGVSGTIRATLPVAEQWVVSLRGGGRTAGDVRIPTDPTSGTRLENTFQRSIDGSAGVGYIGSRVSGGVSVRGYGFSYGLPFPPGVDEVVEVEGRLASATGRVEVALPSKHLPSLRITGSLQDYHHDEVEDGEVEMAFGLRTRTAELLVRQGAVGPFREGAWGATGLFRDYVATGNDQLAPPADSWGIGFFGYQEAPIWESGPTIQLGGRVDRYRIESRADPVFGPGVRRDFTALSGSAGLSVPVAEGISVGLSLGHSFRAPTVEELFSYAPHAGTASFEVGDPTLRPERATGLEGVVRAQRGEWLAELAVYRNAVRDFVHFQSRGDTLIDGTRWPVLAYAQNDARLRGFEASFEWLFARNWVATGRADYVRGDRNDGVALPFMPPPRLGGSLRYENGPASIGAGLRHAFRQDRVGLQYEIPCDSYTLIDLDAGLRVRAQGTTHSITFRLQNAADVLHRDAASRIKDFAPSPGRNLSVLYRVYF